MATTRRKSADRGQRSDFYDHFYDRVGALKRAVKQPPAPLHRLRAGKPSPKPPATGVREAALARPKRQLGVCVVHCGRFCCIMAP